MTHVRGKPIDLQSPVEGDLQYMEVDPANCSLWLPVFRSQYMKLLATEHIAPCNVKETELDSSAQPLMKRWCLDKCK